MAKRPMKKLELLALAKDRDALLKTLQKAGVMELKRAETEGWQQEMCIRDRLPVAMSMACNYAYDPTVIAFSLLGCSLFITEMSRPDKRMDWKRGALMLAAFCIASFPKAVYIPVSYTHLMKT